MDDFWEDKWFGICTIIKNNISKIMASDKKKAIGHGDLGMKEEKCSWNKYFLLKNYYWVIFT